MSPAPPAGVEREAALPGIQSEQCSRVPDISPVFLDISCLTVVSGIMLRPCDFEVIGLVTGRREAIVTPKRPQHNP
jgi:hypothetical protein